MAARAKLRAYVEQESEYRIGGLNDLCGRLYLPLMDPEIDNGLGGVGDLFGWFVLTFDFVVRCGFCTVIQIEIGNVLRRTIQSLDAHLNAVYSRLHDGINGHD